MNPFIIDYLPSFRREANVSSVTPPNECAENDQFNNFWAQYDKINNEIVEIRTQLDEIGNSCESRNTTHDNRDERIERLNSVTGKAQIVRTELQNMEKDIKAAEQENGRGKMTASLRLQRNHYHVLHDRFNAFATQLSEIREKSKSGEIKAIIRHHRIAGVEIDQTTAEQILESDPQVLQENLYKIHGAQSAKLVNTYNQIAARHNDILNIERSMNELLDLFIQFNVLVHDQGRQIDNICSNIETAAEYVKSASNNLEKAKEDQKTGRKCLWWIIAVAIAVIVVVVVLALFLTKKKK